MAWWNAIGDIFKGGKQVAEVFVENKEAKGQRQHDEKIADIGRDMASLDQFAAELVEGVAVPPAVHVGLAEGQRAP